MKNFFINLGYAALSTLITLLFILAIVMTAAAIYHVGSTIFNYLRGIGIL